MVVATRGCNAWEYSQSDLNPFKLPWDVLRIPETDKGYQAHLRNF